MEVYKERETASLHLQWAREEIERKMCPIFKKDCIGDKCLSYAPGYMREWEPRRQTGEYLISPPGCNNAIVTGTIEYQEP